MVHTVWHKVTTYLKRERLDVSAEEKLAGEPRRWLEVRATIEKN